VLQHTAPYQQRIIVYGKTQEEVYDIINAWLRYNNISVTRQEPPTLLEGHYNADVRLFLVGPSDAMPKDINVRISAFGREVLVYFTVTQSIRRKKTAGYIYWGTQLQSLYEELGVEVTDSVWRDLFPNKIVRDTINRRRNTLVEFFLFSLFFLIAVDWLWNPGNDAVIMYFIVIVLPGTLILFWDMQAFRRFLISP
jgi:hypothetical protein